MKTSTQVHLKTIVIVAALSAFVVLCAMRPVVLLIIVGGGALIFVYGTVYIFLSARAVARRRAAAEAASAEAERPPARRIDGGDPAPAPPEMVTPFRFGIRPPRDRSAIGLVPSSPDLSLASTDAERPTTDDRAASNGASTGDTTANDHEPNKPSSVAGSQ
ncbi:MAG: hypothetical protein KC609_02740 [Myxococcales bacterium]|nr:hypothetical protein [Myxococcales bacterium]